MKTLAKYIYHENVNVNLMEENAIQINGGITISFDVNVKTLMYIKKIMFGILVNVFAKMEDIQQTLWMIQRLSTLKL